jgi:hypothetical protein
MSPSITLSNAIGGQQFTELALGLAYLLEYLSIGLRCDGNAQLHGGKRTSNLPLPSCSPRLAPTLS